MKYADIHEGEVSTSASIMTLRDMLLEELYETEAWHSMKAATCWTKKNRDFHRRKQEVIWWAIQELDNHPIDFSSGK